MIPVEQPASATADGVATTSSTPLSASLEGLKVLIVDDELDARELVVVMLGRCGASMKAAASSAEAMEILGSWKPDVLIADIGMPIEDGTD